MTIDRVRAVFQRREVAPLNCFFKRSLQTLSGAKKIQALRVMRALLQTRLGKLPRLPRPRTKLIDDMRVNLVFVLRIERVAVVKR